MASRNKNLATAVSRYAITSRHHPRDHETLARLAEELRRAQAEVWVQNVIKTAPKLTDEQRAELARILLVGDAA